MNYKVILSSEARKALLSKKYEHRIEEFETQIEKLKTFPEKRGKPLKGRLHGLWQLKFGKGDRIWYTIDEGERVVKVVAVLSKKEAQRRY